MRAESANNTGAGRHVSRSSNGYTLRDSLPPATTVYTQPSAQKDIRCGRGRSGVRSSWLGNSRGKRPLNRECPESSYLHSQLAVAPTLSEGELNFLSQLRQEQQQNLQFKPQTQKHLGRRKGTHRRTVPRRAAGREPQGRISALRLGRCQESTGQNAGLANCVDLQPPLQSVSPNANAHAQGGINPEKPSNPPKVRCSNTNFNASSDKVTQPPRELISQSNYATS